MRTVKQAGPEPSGATGHAAPPATAHPAGAMA